MGVSLQTDKPGGKKAVNAELNLVPFIDLLVCCICFLLITAVWTRMAQLPVKQQTPGPAATVSLPTQQPLRLLIAAEGYVLVDGVERLAFPRLGHLYDNERLSLALRNARSRRAAAGLLTIAVQDGVAYHEVVEVVDIARGQHFGEVSVTAGTTG